MSSVIPIAAFPTLATPMAPRKSCRSFLTFPSMVAESALFSSSDTDWVTELSIAPEKNHRLIPPHARRDLALRGLDLDGFVPLSKEEMMARLD